MKKAFLAPETGPPGVGRAEKLGQAQAPAHPTISNDVIILISILDLSVIMYIPDALLAPARPLLA